MLVRARLILQFQDGGTRVVTVVTMQRLGLHAYFFLFDWLQGGNPRERHTHL